MATEAKSMAEKIAQKNSRRKEIHEHRYFINNFNSDDIAAFLKTQNGSGIIKIPEYMKEYEGWHNYPFFLYEDISAQTEVYVLNYFYFTLKATGYVLNSDCVGFEVKEKGFNLFEQDEDDILVPTYCFNSLDDLIKHVIDDKSLKSDFYEVVSLLTLLKHKQTVIEYAAQLKNETVAQSKSSSSQFSKRGDLPMDLIEDYASASSTKTGGVTNRNYEAELAVAISMSLSGSSVAQNDDAELAAAIALSLGDSSVVAQSAQSVQPKQSTDADQTSVVSKTTSEMIQFLEKQLQEIKNKAEHLKLNIQKLDSELKNVIAEETKVKNQIAMLKATPQTTNETVAVTGFLTKETETTDVKSLAEAQKTLDTIIRQRVEKNKNLEAENAKIADLQGQQKMLDDDLRIRRSMLTYSGSGVQSSGAGAALTWLAQTGVSYDPIPQEESASDAKPRA